MRDKHTLTPAVAARLSSAADLLERALQADPHDANVAYLLALAFKRQGKTAEARAVLRRIEPPDADVWLQLGLLSVREGQTAQAEHEFVRAWQLDSSSYEICHNLLFTRLTLNQVEAGAALIPRAIELAATGDEKRFLGLLGALLQTCAPANGDARTELALPDLTVEEERRFLDLIRGLGELEIVLRLLKTLAIARPRSAAVQEAYLEAVLTYGKELFDRCAWQEAVKLLEPFARERPPVSTAARPTLAALFNLLGCCACMNQDFELAVQHFTAALKLADKDPRILQNLALAHELNGALADAEPHWNTYFELIDNRLPAPAGQKDYFDQLAYESVNRLANSFAERERWPSAVRYVQRCATLRPQDKETLERLFHLYNQAKRPAEARKTLRRLRELRPNDPQYDLFELDLVELKNLSDVERILSDVDRILKRHPDDPRVEERAMSMVSSVVPMMGNLCDQLTDQLTKVMGQVRQLPNYQVNWSAVHEVMRDLVKEFQRLRRITVKCAPLVSSEEQRRVVGELTEHIDRKIEVCRSMGG